MLILAGELLPLVLISYSCILYLMNCFIVLRTLFSSRQEFDLQTDKLQQCLRSLDRHVTMTIIAAVCTAFADVDIPLHNLITAATTPMPVSMHIVCHSYSMYSHYWTADGSLIDEDTCCKYFGMYSRKARKDSQNIPYCRAMDRLIITFLPYLE